MDPTRNPERRQEKRSPHSGTIEITFEDPAPITITGELIEISTHGFRVSHTAEALTPGMEVHFKRAKSTGWARVIWTHVLDGQCVSGFLILSN